jgi:hypothetical protein
MRPEQLEYAFDKICFIEQEIEGHFCDCRGDTYEEADTPSATPPVSSPGTTVSPNNP